MKHASPRLVALTLAAGAFVFGFTGCATKAPQGRQLPPYEQPLVRTAVQTVRTTAYTHSEADHTQYGARTALGTRLRHGPIHSAAADWSRWPVGTRFRIRETREVFEVDDYGWALTGRNTIDLYKRTRRQMNRWGVRQVSIEIIRWGDHRQSHAVLQPRKHHAHAARMISEIELFESNNHYASAPVTVIPAGQLFTQKRPSTAKKKFPIRLTKKKTTGSRIPH